MHRTRRQMAPSGALLVLLVLAVGREGALSAAPPREPQCGRRLVSGLFSRPRLPLGYSYVATVPRGACRLNITELAPTDNYIALKMSNSSYIMNGEFALSAPGTYEAAGARFVYTRAAGLDAVVARGPTQRPVDIMILYTEPNPSIKYEYFTESLLGEIDTEPTTRPDVPYATPTPSFKHFRRHHSYETFSRSAVPKSRQLDQSKDTSSVEENYEDNVIGNRKFVWKILFYSQCTRTCGGGIQLGKYRCVEVSTSTGDREVAPVHCFGAAPPPRRRRCGNVPCPPRWRAAAWSACPKCGPAMRTRIVGCVQDHSRGITKISDQKCPAPKPETADKCNIPECPAAGAAPVPQIPSKRVSKPVEHTDAFREGPIYTVVANNTDNIGLEYRLSGAAEWLHTDWSECVGWCVGGGVQSRGVRCSRWGCAAGSAPPAARSCAPVRSCEPLAGHWFTGDWSPCSSDCGGKQVRGVLCVGGTGRHLKDSACQDPRPPRERDCGTECSPAWYSGEWGSCAGDCSGGDSLGVQRRPVECARTGGAPQPAACATPAPPATRPCDLLCNTTTPGSVLPPDLTIESQRISGHEASTVATETAPPAPGAAPPAPGAASAGRAPHGARCADRLRACALALRARLCRYHYYVLNCCRSCAGRTP